MNRLKWKEQYSSPERIHKMQQNRDGEGKKSEDARVL